MVSPTNMRMVVKVANRTKRKGVTVKFSLSTMSVDLVEPPCFIRFVTSPKTILPLHFANFSNRESGW